MATNDIGRVTPIWRGFYSAATTYELNDIVIDTAGSVWWHKSEELTTGVIPEAGEIWDAVIDMSVFSALIQAAITTAQTAVQAAQEAESEVAEDVRRAETAAQSAEASAEAASESAAGVGALAQAAEQSKTEAQTAATQAAASASSAGASATSAGSSAQTAEAAKTAAQTAATQAAGSAETASGAAAVVEQKKAEAIAAIEAKGEDVLESIPEDYTELSGDVGDLKTQLSDISENVKTENIVDEENLLNITGATVEDGFYKFSTYQAYNAYSTASFPHDEFKPNTRYTLSAIFKQEGDDSTKNGLFIQLKYTDNTSSELKIPLNIQNGTMFSIISSAGKTLDKINFSYGHVAYCYIKDLMMVEGTNVPDVFIPYHIITAKDILARNTINTVLETTNPQKWSINKNIKSINHRGYYGFPENTIPAFIESKKRGFSIVETDVRTTSDGVLVLLHDESINRTARNIDGSSIENTVNISNITYAQALEYDFGIYAGAEYAGTKIPTLTEFLTLCHRIGLDCYIEIKAAQAQNIVDTVKRTSMADRCTFISSSTSALSGITELLPKNRLGVVLTEINASNIAAIHLLETADNTVFADLLYHAGTISSSITMLYQEDIPLEVWTVNDSYVIYNMDPYITGITSDNKIGGYESFIGNLADIT